MSPVSFSQLSLAPLGAGDLIDRAVRLYRRHFFVLARIGAPPVIVAAAGSVLATLSLRQFTTTTSDASLALFVGLTIVGVIVFVAGYVFSLIVMGGATRNLVMHLLWDEPVSARTTYSAVRARFWGLLAATLLMMFMGGFAIFLTFLLWEIVVGFVIFGSLMFAQVAPTWFSVVIGVIGGVATAILALWLLFFLLGRVAYVPQAMLVEGKGVLEAFGRSFSLAKGSVRRLMAMAVFSTFAVYSAWLILYAPLLWLGYIIGLSPLNQTDWPAWYVISYNVVWQVSQILLAPIWMLGLSLLYLDERVRHEGYDVELMAARQLPPMPNLAVASPLGTAIAVDLKKAPPPPLPVGSVLGLH